MRSLDFLKYFNLNQNYKIQIKGLTVTNTGDNLVVVHMTGNDLVVCLYNNKKECRSGEFVGVLYNEYRMWVLIIIFFSIVCYNMFIICIFNIVLTFPTVVRIF